MNFPSVEFLDLLETIDVADAVEGRESAAGVLRAVAVAVEAEEVMEMDFLDAADPGLLPVLASPVGGLEPSDDLRGTAVLVDGSSGGGTGFSISIAVESALLAVLGAFLAVVTVLLAGNGATWLLKAGPLFRLGGPVPLLVALFR